MCSINRTHQNLSISWTSQSLVEKMDTPKIGRQIRYAITRSTNLTRKFLIQKLETPKFGELTKKWTPKNVHTKIWSINSTCHILVRKN